MVSISVQRRSHWGTNIGEHSQYIKLKSKEGWGGGRGWGLTLFLLTAANPCGVCRLRCRWVFSIQLHQTFKRKVNYGSLPTRCTAVRTLG